MMSIAAILIQLNESGYTLRGFLDDLLTNPAYRSHPILQSLVEDVPDVLALLVQHKPTKDKAITTVFMMVEEKYCDQIRQLSLRESGFHATATRLTEQQLKEFDLQCIAEQLAEKAPDVWRLFGGLLMADPDRNKRRDQNHDKAASHTETGERKQGNSGVDDGEIQDELLVSDDEDEQVIIADETDDEPEDIEDQRRGEKDALKNIVSTLIRFHTRSQRSDRNEPCV